ncbi:MAG: TraB/GumN family protein [Bacteroidaceae bacterium]|nr:TraB/GumN family protein [Bacteroidaceae bacterium]
MKRFSIMTMLLCMMGIAANAQLIFRVSGGEQTEPSYILGSIHLMSGTMLDSIPGYLKAEGSCKQLYVETDVTDAQYRKNIHDAGMQMLTLPDSLTIFDVMGEERIGLLQERLKESCHINLTDSTSRILWDKQPVMFTTMINSIITVEVLRQFPGFLKGGLLDGACIARAKGCGWKVGELDERLTEEERKKNSEKLIRPIDEQLDSLMALLNNFDKHRQEIINVYEGLQQINDYWMAGDYEGFEKYFLPQVDSNQAIYADRNKRWIPKMQDAMKEMPTLFVFGAGHLVGEQGVIQLLRDKGYKVEQVKE